MTAFAFFALAAALLLLIVRLRRSEELFRLVANNSTDVVGLHASDGTPLWVSPSVERVLGYTPREMLGRNAYDFFHPNDKARIREEESHAKALLGESSVRTTYRARRKDGSYVWLETLTIPVVNRQGEVVQLRTSTRDVTAQKDAEDLYRFLIRNLPDTSVFLFDRSYRHIIAEGTMLHRTIHPNAQLERKTLWEVFPEDIASTLAPYYKMVFKGDARSIVEVFRTRMYECHFLPVRDAAGNVKAGLAVFIDVTEKRMRLRELEDRSADLERSNRDLEQFANVASHELKSPLRRIASFADLLAEEITRPNEVEEYVSHIVEGIESLNDVIDSLLTYSRVQTNRLNFTWVDANEVFDQAIHNILPLVRERKAVITKGLLPNAVVADPVLLRQLFENLIGNGVKFNTSGRRPEVVVTAKRDLLDWVFSIYDNGDGLDPDLHKKVFVMFQRLRPDVEGTGIGLALCKKIVGIHRGKIWFDKPEKSPGTVFRFTLPARTPDEITGPLS